VATALHRPFLELFEIGQVAQAGETEQRGDLLRYVDVANCSPSSGSTTGQDDFLTLAGARAYLRGIR
jgi:hypothetical protein